MKSGNESMGWKYCARYKTIPMAVSQTPYTVKVVNKVNISCMDTR